MNFRVNNININTVTSKLEPLCDFEQSEMLRDLGMRENSTRCFKLLIDEETGNDIIKEVEDNVCIYNNNDDWEISRPTISIAKNWLYVKYGIWIETTRSGIIIFNSTACVKEHSIKTVGINPHIVESACLSECLKKLIDEKNNS